MRVPSVVFGKMSSTIRQKHYCTVFLQFDARCHPIGFFDFAQQRFCRISTQTFDRFSENVSCICRKRERSHGDMSLSARHLPKKPSVRYHFIRKTHGFPDCAPFVRRSSVVHNCFIRFFRILCVGHGSQPHCHHLPLPSFSRISEICGIFRNAVLRNIGGLSRF